MSENIEEMSEIELTPLEKVEAFYEELIEWYGDGDKKELRAAAKLLIVALHEFSIHGGPDWHFMVKEYMEILKNDPEKFQKILISNRGVYKDKKEGMEVH